MNKKLTAAISIVSLISLVFAGFFVLEARHAPMALAAELTAHKQAYAIDILNAEARGFRQDIRDCTKWYGREYNQATNEQREQCYSYEDDLVEAKEQKELILKGVK